MEKSQRGIDSMDEINTKPWFENGLSFKCTGCGKCCTGSDGYVFLSPTDIERLAIHFSTTREEFIAKYTRIVENEIVLLDSASSECIFLKDNKCDVYLNRPVQCRTFPWWIDNIRSEKAWNEAASYCEGINHKDSILVPASEIQAQNSTYLDNLLEKNFD